MNKPFYITSPIFYPNANLHLGHAYSMTLCDIIARWHRLSGNDTCFLTGADENTSTVIKAAEAAGKPVEEYLKDISTNFERLFKDLNTKNDVFIRTTDKDKHWPGAVKLWQALDKAGDIYKSNYVGHYCPNCAAFYTEKELVDGKCPVHSTIPERLEEENYFFRLSKYTKPIKEKIENGELQVIPETRRNEILALLNRGLEDISFSRPKSAVPHAIPVPGDDSQVMYVWCDALTSYMSGVGFGSNEVEYKKWWPADIHLIGKDILRFHTAIWPAMLLSAGLPLPKTIFVHGLILSGGQKMSKTLGNVIDPYELINEYGADAVRYYLARKISPFEDGDLTRESFKDAYNADLANGLGNLVSRIMTMVENNNVAFVLTNPQTQAIDNYDVKKYTDLIWLKIQNLDRKIQEEEPFKLFKTDKDKAHLILHELCTGLLEVAYMLRPVMPETAEKIIDYMARRKKPETPLFARKD